MAYAIPHVLISVHELARRLDDPTIKIIEVDVDPKQYEAGHIPGAIGLDWARDLQDRVRRDIPTQDALEHLLGARGVRETDTIVLYGDSGNWFAAYAFWVLKLYGHADVRLLNGGRAKWLADDSLPFTKDIPHPEPTRYRAKPASEESRARLAEVLHASQSITQTRGRPFNLVDVRSPDEFVGKIVAPPGLPETAQRAGHIPGATNIPWGSAVNPDGTFKSAEELRLLYVDSKGLDPARDTIAYCRIGERSSHTWFVLKYLLGFDRVKNYDGSWTEYGNLIGVPIHRPAGATTATTPGTPVSQPALQPV